MFHGHQYSRWMSEKVGAVTQSAATATLPQCGMHAWPMQTGTR
ncbi:lactate dehydrogenase [Xanthomonas citri pv. citri]|nr:lactate dehydrogenase [Xanthomonas citri pv. citri]OLR70623.1 lactate dehydrogenase [Xanthomonas citri pv. citri]